MKPIYIVTALFAGVWLGGCADPLSQDNTLGLQQQIIRSNRQQIKALGQSAAMQVQSEQGDSYLEKDQRRIKQLDAISGPTMFTKITPNLGVGLDGKAPKIVRMSLRKAIRTAVKYNLDVSLARLQPAASEAQLASAQAVFDAVFFSEFGYGNSRQPTTVSSMGGVSFGQPVSKSETVNLITGIRKPLETGGQVTLSTGFDYANSRTPGTSVTPDPSFASRATLAMSQPLLRNFGSPVTRSQIALSHNAHRRDVLTLHAQLLITVAEVEQAYWQLLLAHQQLAIMQRLYDMTVETRDKIKARQDFDVNPVQMAQAQSFVDSRRGDLVRARTTVYDASDNLKRLLQDPNLPLSGEILVKPIETPVALPVKYNLLDSVTTALRKRPEVRGALLDIDDASIRQMVADNQRLPMLDINAQMTARGLDDGLDQAYSELGEADFIEYLISAQFEAPIGNRAAEAEFRRMRILRQQSVVGYVRSVRNVVHDVKGAIRQLRQAWELIGVSRSERRAAAENLRALNEREKEGEALTPEFLLDLKLSTQRRLADAESRELQALVDYNNTIARLQQAIGTGLEYSQIELKWPRRMFAK